jgi:hypothetical protein
MRVVSASPAYSSQPTKDLGVHGSSASAGIDKEFVISTANSLQALLVLSNLIHTNADDPAKVRLFTHLVEQRVQALGKLICPMLWSSI